MWQNIKKIQQILSMAMNFVSTTSAVEKRSKVSLDEDSLDENDYLQRPIEQCMTSRFQNWTISIIVCYSLKLEKDLSFVRVTELLIEPIEFDQSIDDQFERLEKKAKTYVEMKQR